MQKKAFPRLLRTYTALARECHHCSMCQKSIMPGEEYEGRVIALGNGKLYVGKDHYPYCPDLLDPDEDWGDMDITLGMDMQEDIPFELPLAA